MRRKTPHRTIYATAEDVTDPFFSSKVRGTSKYQLSVVTNCIILCPVCCSYKKTVKELSGVFRDQMNEPLDAAVYWTEYTIRHKGAAHLRPPSKNLNWFQSNLYDLLLVFLVSLLVVLCIVRSILRCVIRALFGSKQKLKKQ